LIEAAAELAHGTQVVYLAPAGRPAPIDRIDRIDQGAVYVRGEIDSYFVRRLDDSRVAGLSKHTKGGRKYVRRLDEEASRTYIA
jgi:hypothetical protein